MESLTALCVFYIIVVTKFALVGLILFLYAVLALVEIILYSLFSATVVILVNVDPFFFFALCCSDKDLPLT
jgi:hypothetical protein